MISLSVVTIALNEEEKIADSLNSTKDWANEHIIVDGFSTDKTVEIASKYTDKIFQRKMDIEGVHRNWAYSKAQNEWVLSLDADEIVTDELKKEIEEIISKEEDFVAYTIPLRTYIGNYWVKHGGWYPGSKVRLFKKSKFKYEEVGVHPRIFLEGKNGHLKKDIIHKGYKDLSELFSGLNAQTTLEAEKWFQDKRKVNAFTMIRKTVDRFLRSYVRKKGYKDGFIGFSVSLNAGLYQIFTHLKYMELKRNRRL